MSEFKNQEEVLRALLGGKILISNDNWYKIAEGTVMAKAIDGQDTWWPVLQDFSDYKKYSTYTGPKKNKTITVAPAVIKNGYGYILTEQLFETRQEAKDTYPSSFCDWLIAEMPIKIEEGADEQGLSSEQMLFRAGIPY
jgi:hypothetical protein